MYVNPISTRLFSGKSTPAIRATLASVTHVSRSAVRESRTANNEPRRYPCLCLCFGTTQMMRTTPCRRTILHLAQILLTDDRTFIKPPRAAERGPLFVSVRDSSPRQVVRRQLDENLVSGKNSNEVFAHLAGDVSQHL